MGYIGSTMASALPNANKSRDNSVQGFKGVHDVFSHEEGKWKPDLHKDKGVIVRTEAQAS